MTKYTDEDVDAVALAIRNAAFTGADVSHIGQCGNCGRWRTAARAALAARDALFEVTGERWVVEVVGGRTTYWSPLNAFRARDGVIAKGCEAKVVHVTTKRRKR